MGLFKRRDQTKEDLEAMREEMRMLREHLDQTDAVKDRLTERLGHLDAENERLQRHVGTVEERVVDGLRNQLEELGAGLQRQQAQIADVAIVATDAAERSEQTDAKVSTPSPDEAVAKRQLGQLAERVAGLDARVNQVSLEITNQLTELSSELDRAGEQTDTSELIDRINARLVDISTGQERLANEQARYAIQFREDLAELADRLRKK